MHLNTIGMDKIFKEDLLQNAIEIGKEILEKASVDINGIYWKTVKEVNIFGEAQKHVCETIYCGVSGVALFYIELYKHSPNESYREIIFSCGNWLVEYCKNNPATHGFYSGRLGTVYALIEMSELEGCYNFRQKALEIAYQFKNITQTPIIQSNLFNGLGGTLLGLLHLHSKTREEWILTSIEEGIYYLLSNSQSDGIGLYWDLAYETETRLSTKPLSSLPFGTAGIGFLFLQLSVYFENTSYNFIAEQCFLYEGHHEDGYKDIWPNFQINTKSSDKKKLRKAYLAGNFNHFMSNENSLNWVFGITGIGFSRLFGHKVSQNIRYKLDLDVVMSKLNRDLFKGDLHNYSLSTGKTGVGLLFLMSSNFSEELNYNELVIKIASECLAEKRKKRFFQSGYDTNTEIEDESLFMGTAGIGYFYLKLLAPENKSCILLPELLDSAVINHNHKLRQIDESQLLELLLASWFPRTFDIIKENESFQSLKFDFNELKMSFIKEIKKTIYNDSESLLNDVIDYEYVKFESDSLITRCYPLFRFTNQIEHERTLHLLRKQSDSALMKAKLIINPYFKLISGVWNCTESFDLINKSEIKEVSFVLYSRGNGEVLLNEIQYKILECFTKSEYVKEVLASFMDANKFDLEEGKMFKGAFFDILKFFLSSDVLMVANKRNQRIQLFLS